ncbi:MAG: ABC-F family ATP-binding cassette domain-containing protein [Bdellovibrionaceae bacterium]|nr:ABC-F family ATP-binding cassette domain-containing protein [Pseudobdellovibrionaceae bacterium]
MALLINTYQLEKSFAGKTLFSGVSFGLEEGDKAGLVGPNGAGKSTLMKILAGVSQPDDGKVTAKKGLKIGFLPQTPEFPPGQTIMEALLSKAPDEHEAIAPAYEWMARLDLNQFGEDFLVSKLSGGWQKRVALARELVLSPELLLLDEPTNHLDVVSILWLEDFLQRASFAFLMVTHDRLFLQRVVNKVFDLDPRNPNNLFSVSGDYVQYLETKEQLLAAQAKLEHTLKNTLRRETEWLRRGAIARLAKQKARINRAGDLKEDVENLTEKNRSRTANISFGDAERNPQKLIEVKNLSKSFNGRILFEDFTYLITPKTRLALLGENGTGKSTLIKIMLGYEQPDMGTVFLSDKVKVSYFEQTREGLDMQKTVLKNVCPDGDYVFFQGQYVFGRSYLERFLFSRQQMDLPVSRLSGGEQSRLRLAQLMLQDASVLVLDEPTNDLDTATLEVLSDAIQNFNGAVILVTHDRYFMDQVATDILGFPRKEGTKKKLERFVGYLQWEEAWFAGESSQEEPSFVKNNDSEKSTKRPQRMSFKLKNELEGMEAKILELEEELSSSEKMSALPEVVSSPEKVQELYQTINGLRSEIDRLYARWAELEKVAAEIVKSE